MKFHFTLSITLLILATTTQGFHIKSAIKSKLPLLISSISGPLKQKLQSTNSAAGSTSNLFAGSTQNNNIESSNLSGFISNLSQQITQSLESPSTPDAIPPTVTLYEYPPQHQVIYRTIRPVVRRTIYVQEPTYSLDRGIAGLSSLLPGALSTIKSSIGGVFGNTASALLSSPASPPAATVAPATPAVSAPQSYYFY